MKEIEINTIKDLMLTIVEAIDDGSIISNNKDYREMIVNSLDRLK